MAKMGIKETLLSTLVNGKETINALRVMRKVNQDKISSECVYAAANRIHPKSLNLVLNEKIDTKQGAQILRFVSKDGYLPPFQAGQYINVFAEIDGCRVSRPYSLSGSPKNKAYYEITVEEVPGGFVSKFMTKDLKVGDTVTTSGPAGHFVYNPVFHKKESLFLAGGSSITPFLSMIRQALDSGEDRNINLIYGSKDLKHAIYHDELSEYAKKFDNFKYTLILSDEDSNWKGEVGFITKEIIKKYCPDYKERTAYICGPNVMHSFVRNNLLILGLKEKDIRDEMFGAPLHVTDEPGWPEEVKSDDEFNVKIGDKVIKAKASESLLVALERNNIRVNVCCRCGECSLCRVKLISGKVFLAKGMLLRAADEKFGYIHSCKSYPISDIEIAL